TAREAGRRAPLLEAPPRAACSAPAPSTRRRRGSSSCSRSPAGTTRRRWPRLSVASEKDGAVRRAEIFARDDQTCVYCGRRAPDVELSVDHVEPRMRGGDNSAGNVVTACVDCNRAKGGLAAWAYLAERHEERARFQIGRASCRESVEM